LISLSDGFTIDIFSFLFGSILLVSVEDTILILSLTGIILDSMKSKPKLAEFQLKK
jgi:zinc transport system permease protein